MRIHEGFKRVCENLKGNRKPVGFAKAYLSGFYETARLKPCPFVLSRFFIQIFGRWNEAVRLSRTH
jgi:hypothetical protein